MKDVVILPTGPQGKSTYEEWLAQGNTGSFEDFMGTLVGEGGDGARPYSQTNALVNGSMTLCTLDHVPTDLGLLNIFINGVRLTRITDFTVTGFLVTATAALNQRYGGASSDGEGFEASDVLVAQYRY